MSDWIYPYDQLFGDVALDLGALSIDHEPVPPENVDSDYREVRLIDLEREGWQRAELEIVLSGPAPELRELDTAGAAPNAVALLHCSASNSRQGVKLERDPNNNARWKGSVELERSTWFGRIDLRGAIVATVDGVPDRIIGTADEWALRLDDVPPPPVSGAIAMRWEDFRDPSDGHIWLKEFDKEAAFIRLDDDEPILYLNSGFEGLKALLDRKSKRHTAEQALHEQTRATIAGDAWSALFNAAVQAIRWEGDEDPDWPEESWKRTALEMLLPRLHPDMTIQDALREVAERRSDADAGGPLQQDIFMAVSRQVGGAKRLRQAILELNKAL